MTTDYAQLKTDIETWLQQHDVKHSIRFIGDACPMFCADKGKSGIGTFPRETHIHGQHYQLTLERQRGTYRKLIVVDYWNSYHDAMISKGMVENRFAKVVADQIRRATWDERKAAKVHAADVLGCCEMFAPSSFEDWCSDFGYDSDSRKAESIYRAVQEQAEDFQRMFTSEELTELSEKLH